MELFSNTPLLIYFIVVMVLAIISFMSLLFPDNGDIYLLQLLYVSEPQHIIRQKSGKLRYFCSFTVFSSLFLVMVPSMAYDQLTNSTILGKHAFLALITAALLLPASLRIIKRLYKKNNIINDDMHAFYNLLICKKSNEVTEWLNSSPYAHIAVKRFADNEFFMPLCEKWLLYQKLKDLPQQSTIIKKVKI